VRVVVLSEGEMLGRVGRRREPQRGLRERERERRAREIAGRRAAVGRGQCLQGVEKEEEEEDFSAGERQSRRRVARSCRSGCGALMAGGI